MTTSSSPFSAIGDALNQLGSRLGAALKPPAWLTQEAQNRLVLFLNHVLMQEPAAQARLAPQAGRVVRLQWRSLAMQLRATPAGLWELAPDAAHDLLLTLAEDAPLALVRGALRGQRPDVRIEGDVRLAGDINWLADNVRWDVEDDLARVVGGPAAHQMARVARGVADAARRFAAGLPTGNMGKSGADKGGAGAGSVDQGAAARPAQSGQDHCGPDQPAPPRAGE